MDYKILHYISIQELSTSIISPPHLEMSASPTVLRIIPAGLGKMTGTCQPRRLCETTYIAGRHQHTSLSKSKANLTLTTVYGIPAMRTFERADKGYILISPPSGTPTAKEKVEGEGSLIEVLLCTPTYAPSPLSDPSNNSGDVLLLLAILGAKILATVWHYTSLTNQRGWPLWHFTPAYHHLYCQFSEVYNNIGKKNTFLGEKSA